MESKEVTIYDIAKKLNIAASTVSRGLKGHYTVSQRTQELITTTAREMGYRFNTFASNLRRQKTDNIGLIIPKLNSNFMAQVIAGIEKITNEAGMNLIISQSLEDIDKEAKNVRTMFNSRVDGLLVSLTEKTQDINHFEIFTEKAIPILFFDRVPSNSPFPTVVIDNEEAGYIVTRHILERGAKRIAHITGNLSSNVYKERLLGYKRALQEAEISFSDSLVLNTSLNYESGKQVAQDLIALKAQGAFIASDACAAGCINELKERSLRLPEDMLIAGFNNDILSRVVEPALTTINYPGFEMGEVAARQLIMQLNDKLEIGKATKVVLDSDLIIRRSTGNH